MSIETFNIILAVITTISAVSSAIASWKSAKAAETAAYLAKLSAEREGGFSTKVRTLFDKATNNHP